MKFLYKKRRQQDLQKIASLQEQLENINGLVDPLERALSLEKLRDEADRARCGVSGRIHDNCVLLGLGGGVVMVAGMATAAPLAVVLGFMTAMGNLMLGDEFPKPEEKPYENLLGRIDSALETITKKTSLEACAASPRLGEALRHFPALRERFEDAANTERFQKIASPQPSAVGISKPLVFNNKDGKGPAEGFRL